jgi:hypothetical protein
MARRPPLSIHSDSVIGRHTRKAWHDGLLNNCEAPCHLDPMDVEKFLADVPAMHVGDIYSLLFEQHGVTAMTSGQLIGTISSPPFAEAMLATFLGPNPASPRLKNELLSAPGEAGAFQPVKVRWG